MATRLVAEGGAQGWIVSAVRRGWAGPMERRGGPEGAEGGGRRVGRHGGGAAGGGGRCAELGRVGDAAWLVGGAASGSEARAQVKITNGFPMGFNHTLRRGDRRLIPSGEPW